MAALRLLSHAWSIRVELPATSRTSSGASRQTVFPLFAALCEPGEQASRHVVVLSGLRLVRGLGKLTELMPAEVGARRSIDRGLGHGTFPGNASVAGARDGEEESGERGVRDYAGAGWWH